jgi:Fic family protein
MTLEAQLSAEKMIQFTVKKAQFFDQNEASLNERQIKVINRMLEEAPEKFQGGMNATKYIGITSTSKATATRDLQQLVEKNIFVVIAAGRSTRYEINL